jgi:hypothetical protein
LADGKEIKSLKLVQEQKNKNDYYSRRVDNIILDNNNLIAITSGKSVLVFDLNTGIVTQV